LRLKPTLPFVDKSPKFTILISSDDEEADPVNSNVVKHAPMLLKIDIKLEQHSCLNSIHVDSVDLEDDDGSEDFSIVAAQSPTNSVPLDIFVVSEMPSWTVGSDSFHTSEAAMNIFEIPSGFRSSYVIGSTQSSKGELVATSTSRVWKLEFQNFKHLIL
jgi:hypothetical protein